MVLKILQKASDFMIGNLEKFFYRWGKFVSLHPYPVILVSLLLTGLAGIGFLNFHQEHRANYLWIPPTSDYNVHEAWLEDNFKKTRREEMVIYTADNVLTPKGIHDMYQIYKAVAGITVNGSTFQDICTKIPIADIFHSTRVKRDTTGDNSTDVEEEEEEEEVEEVEEEEEEEEYENLWADYDYDSEVDTVVVKVQPPRIEFNKFGKDRKGKRTYEEKVDLPDDIFCNLNKNLKDLCLETSLLDIWKYDEGLIATTTQQEIIDAVNLLTNSPWLSYAVNYTNFLGKKVYNSTGHIVGAESATLYWEVKLPDVIDEVNVRGGVEVDLADPLTLAWEEQFIGIVRNFSFEDAEVYINAGRSFGDVSAEAIFFDGIKMMSGYLLMFAYTIFMLGKLNTLEMRMYLAIVGIICIGMGLIFSIGLTVAIGFPYTPMHAALPFLALGIGIDDMFVVVQCWVNLEKSGEIAGLPLSEAMGLTLKHAGVAVTITSLTDVFAFAVGSVTNMPGLQSFCIATAICLSAIYLLVISWFTAFMTLDQRRIMAGRNGIFPCYIHKDFQPSSLSKLDLGQKVLDIYAKVISTWPFRVIVLLITGGILGVGIWGATLIRQNFDPILLLPSDTYLRKFVAVGQESYPSNGWVAEVYLGRMNYTSLDNLNTMTNQLQALVDEKKYLNSLTTWWQPLVKFAKEEKNFSSWKEFRNPVDFPIVLGDFLFSKEGSEYKYHFKWDGELQCRQPAPPILASKFKLDYFLMSGPEEHIPAKTTVEGIINGSAVSDVAFSHVKIYAAWETDQIIGYELWRNVAMSMGCVMIVTIILLVNIPMSFYVFLCVLATLMDIIGFLHFWDMTIDIITCVNIVLSIGLCVDYSVHMGHAYLVAKGSRKEKAMQAVEDIGPAVFNGGFTTFLALALLGSSTSQIFLTFFKVFLLTVIFGLWHGLVALPTVLSIIGPLNNTKDSDSESTTASSVQTQESPTLSISSIGGSIDKTVHTNLAYINSEGEVEPTAYISGGKLGLQNILFQGRKGSWNVNHDGT